MRTLAIVSCLAVALLAQTVHAQILGGTYASSTIDVKVNDIGLGKIEVRVRGTITEVASLATIDVKEVIVTLYRVKGKGDRDPIRDIGRNPKEASLDKDKEKWSTIFAPVPRSKTATLQAEVTIKYVITYADKTTKKGEWSGNSATFPAMAP